MATISAAIAANTYSGILVFVYQNTRIPLGELGRRKTRRWVRVPAFAGTHSWRGGQGVWADRRLALMPADVWCSCRGTGCGEAMTQLRASAFAARRRGFAAAEVAGGVWRRGKFSLRIGFSSLYLDLNAYLSRQLLAGPTRDGADRGMIGTCLSVQFFRGWHGCAGAVRAGCDGSSLGPR
jgi:hypothetical protein